MISKISRGWRIGGLMRYLMGPGRFNEHHDQRIIATWDGEPELHQPQRGSGGEFDVRDLVAALTDPAVAAGIPHLGPPHSATGKVPRGPVWHCSLRNHADDRVLSDAEWAEVVTDLMDRTGIAPRDDVEACRWVAVRHADDHVHIAAMLVRQDNGRRVHPHNDYKRVRTVCHLAEKRLNLVRTAPSDRTAIEPPARAELEKAARRGVDEPSRIWLRRAARVAAVQARDPEEYFRRLADLGVLCRPKERPPGHLVGYAVAAPGDVTAAGRPVWYSGSRLGRDLTLPKLLTRWASARPPAGPLPPAPGERSQIGQAERAAATSEAVSAIDHATAALAAGEDDEAAGVAHAAGDMVVAVCAVTHQRGQDRRQHWQPADVYARAAGTPQIVQPPRLGPVADQLRTAAYRLIAVRSLAGRRDDHGGATELVIALAALIAEIAAYHERCRHLAQADAARRSAQLLREHHHPAARVSPPRAASLQRRAPAPSRTTVPHTPPTAAPYATPGRQGIHR